VAHRHSTLLPSVLFDGSVRTLLDILIDSERAGRNVGREQAGAAILREVVLYRSGVADRHRDDVVQLVSARLHRAWEAGDRDLATTKRVIPTAVFNQGVSAYRKDRSRRETSLAAPVGDGNELGDLLRDVTADVVDRVIAREFLAEQPALHADLAAFLAEARPIVTRIEALARMGLPRDAIARLLEEEGFVAANGVAMTSRAVAKVVSRDLQSRFPELRELWANRAPDGALAHSGAAARERAAAKRLYNDALEAADEPVRALAALRGAGTTDWSMLAGALNQRFAEPHTATCVRALWRSFVSGLPMPARRVAP
jgi:hypothetical protein